MTRCRFLFLQGVASPFFARLADRLQDQGHRIFRINFCAGDALYWGRRPCWQFRSGLEDLPRFLNEKFAAHAFSDLILFGDQRPIHRIAIQIARDRDARVHVVEEGYLRPHWFTLERGGVNAASPLPKDPSWYLLASDYLPPPDDVAPVVGDIRIRALHDMAYHFANLANPVAFPGYRTHRPHHALIEYAGWVKRYSFAPWYRRKDRQTIQALCTRDTPFYLLPLQLNADFQISRHSPFRSMREVITSVTASFAEHAPKDALLVIKNHPLDTGLVNYHKTLHELIGRFSLNDRVRYLESGDLAQLFDYAAGLITVNSTVGLAAILRGLPVCTLGKAIYALPGLVHQGDLDSFWKRPVKPDDVLAAAFRRVVVHTTQVNGDLYTSPGIRQALLAIPRCLEPDSRLDQCLARTDRRRRASSPMQQAHLT